MARRQVPAARKPLLLPQLAYVLPAAATPHCTRAVPGAWVVAPTRLGLVLHGVVLPVLLLLRRLLLQRRLHAHRLWLLWRRRGVARLAVLTRRWPGCGSGCCLTPRCACLAVLPVWWGGTLVKGCCVDWRRISVHCRCFIRPMYLCLLGPVLATPLLAAHGL